MQENPSNIIINNSPSYSIHVIYLIFLSISYYFFSYIPNNIIHKNILVIAFMYRKRKGKIEDRREKRGLEKRQQGVKGRRQCVVVKILG